MRLETARFGVLSVNEADFIEFPAGLPGFPGARKYVLIEHSEGQVFHIMQSVDDPALAFILIDPAVFVADYQARVEKDELAELQLGADDVAVVRAIVTVPRDNPSALTANLQAPIVLNPRTRIGRQVVLNDSSYGIRHPLLPVGGEDTGSVVGAGSGVDSDGRAGSVPETAEDTDLPAAEDRSAGSLAAPESAQEAG